VATIYIGDTHGRFDILRHIIALFKSGMVVCNTSGDVEPIDEFVVVGDFGFFPRIAGVARGIMVYDKYINDEVTGGVPVRWIDGNHEDHETLKGMVESGVMTYEGYSARHIKRGTYENKRLYLGGADSIDKGSRTPGVDWFHGENITMGNYYEACGNVEVAGDQRIDLLVTHELPLSLLRNIATWDSKSTPDGHANRTILDELYRGFKPSIVIHGHHHNPKCVVGEHDDGTKIVHVSLGNVDNGVGRRWLSLDYDLHCMKSGEYGLEEIVNRQRELAAEIVDDACCIITRKNTFGYCVVEGQPPLCGIEPDYPFPE
jgi:hypothetical protein